MKRTEVRVPWPHGLNLQPAGHIARVAQKYSAKVRLCVGEQASEATSVLGLVILCATLNTALTVEADGADESEAIKAIVACFDGSEKGHG